MIIYKALSLNYMKLIKPILFLLLMISSGMAISQSRHIYVKTYKDGDTTGWYKWHKEHLAKMHLPDIMNSEDSVSFRIAHEGMMLSISTNKDNLYKGSVSFYFDKIIKQNEYGAHKKKFVYKTYRLPADTAKLIGEFFIGKEIHKIPPADSINWRNGNDGTTYMIEYSTDNEYTFKDYWCPGCGYEQSAYDTALTALEKYITPIANIYERKFIETLKPGTYSDGSIMDLLVPNRKMNRQYKKSMKKQKKASFAK